MPLHRLLLIAIVVVCFVALGVDGIPQAITFADTISAVTLTTGQAPGQVIGGAFFAEDFTANGYIDVLTCAYPIQLNQGGVTPAFIVDPVSILVHSFVCPLQAGNSEAVDIDGDGLMDVAIIRIGNVVGGFTQTEMLWYRRTSTNLGTLFEPEPAVTLSINANFISFDSFWSDLDGDDVSDLILFGTDLLQANTFITWFRNTIPSLNKLTISPTLVGCVVLPKSFQLQAEVTATIGDVNGDSWPDIVFIAKTATSSSYQIYYMLNSAAAPDAPGISCSATRFGTPVLVPTSSVWPANTNILSVALVDINADGLDDIVGIVAASGVVSTIATILNAGAPNWLSTCSAGCLEQSGFFATTSTIVKANFYPADFNADGFIDIALSLNMFSIASGETAMLYLLTNEGTSTPSFQTTSIVQLPPVTVRRTVAVRDVDADGLIDILYVSQDGTTIEFLQNESGQPGLYSPVPLNSVMSSSATVLFAVGLINQDNFDDIVLVNAQSTASGGCSVSLSWQSGVGDGTFATTATTITWPNMASANLVSVSCATLSFLAEINDVDGDGLNDIWLSINGNFITEAWLRNTDGSGSFTSGFSVAIDIPFQPSNMSSIFIRTTGTTQKTLDRIVCHVFSCDLYINPGKPSIAFKPLSILPFAAYEGYVTGFQYIAVGDVNMDSLPDVVMIMTEPTYNYVAWSLNQGGGVFGEWIDTATAYQQLYELFTNEEPIVWANVIDIDSNGFNDILIGCTTLLAILPGGVGGLAEEWVTYNMPCDAYEAFAITIVDFDGDGLLDLVVNCYFTTGLVTRSGTYFMKSYGSGTFSAGGGQLWFSLSPSIQSVVSTNSFPYPLPQIIIFQQPSFLTARSTGVPVRLSSSTNTAVGHPRNASELDDRVDFPILLANYNPAMPATASAFEKLLRPYCMGAMGAPVVVMFANPPTLPTTWNGIVLPFLRSCNLVFASDALATTSSSTLAWKCSTNGQCVNGTHFAAGRGLGFSSVKFSASFASQQPPTGSLPCVSLTSTSATILQSVFQGCNQALVVTGSTSLRVSVTSSTFSKNTNLGSGTVAAMGVGVQLTANVFDSNYAIRNGGALAVSSGGLLVLRGSNVFSSNSAGVNGGAIFVADSSSTVISIGSTFSANIAAAGGAIYAQGRLWVFGGTLNANKAVNGGGVYITSSATDAPLTLRDVTMISNVAGHNGGAIFFAQASVAPQVINGVANSNVATTGLGDFMYSFSPVNPPVLLNITPVPAQGRSPAQQWGTSFTGLTVVVMPTTILSGIPFNLQLALVDQYGHMSAVDDSALDGQSSCAITISSGNGVIISSPVGGLVPLEGGKCLFVSAVLTGAPNTAFSIVVTAKPYGSAFAPLNTSVGQFTLAACQPGQPGCQGCDPGTFRLGTNATCIACTPQLSCNGNAPQAAANYYIIATNTSLQVGTCPNDWCTGGSTVCKPGHDPATLVCGGCAAGYKFWQGECHRCDDSPSAGFILLYLGMLLWVFFVYYFSPGVSATGILSTLTFFFQVIALISTTYASTETTLVSTTWTNVANLEVTFGTCPNALLGMGTSAGLSSFYVAFWLKFIQPGVLLLFLAVAIVLDLILTPILSFKTNLVDYFDMLVKAFRLTSVFTFDQTTIKDKFIKTLVQICVLSYIPVMRTLLETMRCVDAFPAGTFNNQDVYLLAADPSIQCSAWPYPFYFGFSIMLSLLLGLIPFIIFAAVLARVRFARKYSKNKKDVFELINIQQSSTSNLNNNRPKRRSMKVSESQVELTQQNTGPDLLEVVLHRAGHVIAPFKKNFVWWWLITELRKLVAVLIIVFTANFDFGLQRSLLVSLFVALAWIQMQLQPFSSWKTAAIDSAALILLSIAALSSQPLVDGFVYTWVAIAVFVAVWIGAQVYDYFVALQFRRAQIARAQAGEESAPPSGTVSRSTSFHHALNTIAAAQNFPDAD